MDVPDPLVGTLFDGRFLVERALASGGMGAVYVALQQPVGRRVALKVIKDDKGRGPELVARFERETAALCALSHPNVVTMFDCGNDNGNLFLVMELLAGRTLRDELESMRADAKVMAAKRALRIASDIARALVAVHGAGIVHRDLKPENVFLTSTAGHADFAKVLDFGIVNQEAAQTGPRLTQAGGFIGTAGYGSPEQLTGGAATAASDLYALGVILYEMLTGVSPFDAPTVQAMFVRQLVDPLVPPSALTPAAEVPPVVDGLVMSLMAREPAERPPSAAAVVARIDELLEMLQGERSTSIPVAAARSGNAIAPLRPTAATETSAHFALPAPPAVARRAAEHDLDELDAVAPRRGWPTLVAACAIAALAGVGTTLVLRPTAPEPARVAAPAAPVVVPPANPAPVPAEQVAAEKGLAEKGLVEKGLAEKAAVPTPATAHAGAQSDPRTPRYRLFLEPAIRAMGPMMEACLAAHPPHPGEPRLVRFVLALQVGVDGHLEGVVPRARTASPIAFCIADKLKAATLPRPPGGAPLDIDQLFVLDRGTAPRAASTPGAAPPAHAGAAADAGSGGRSDDEGFRRSVGGKR